MKRAIAQAPWARCGAAALVVMVAACSEPAADGATASEPLQMGAMPSTAVPANPARPAATAAMAAEQPGTSPTTATAPEPPRVPYAFLGKWTTAGRTVVYLKRGDHSVVVNAPGPLDAQYAVQSLDERRIVLKYLPLGTLHDIVLDAAPGSGSAPGGATATARLAPVAPAATDSEDTQSDN